ncbi:hypothetical protein D3C75_1269120 [compost metagenome]
MMKRDERAAGARIAVNVAYVWKLRVVFSQIAGNFSDYRKVQLAKNVMFDFALRIPVL